MEELLKGVNGNFGGSTGEDRSTLRGLIQFVKAWSEGGDSDLQGLTADITNLAARCQQAAVDTARDLEEDHLDPSLANSLEGLKECFGDSVEELGRLLELLRTHQDVRECLECLEALQAEIQLLSRCLTGWTAGREPLCLRCGSKGSEQTCPQCQLERLIPDPSPDTEVRSAHLGPRYVPIYQTYRDVVNGDRTLSELHDPLRSLEKEWQQVLRLARHSPIPLLQDVEIGLRGLAQMRLTWESRQARDLNEGWSRVFQCATALAQKLPAVLRQSGQTDEADALESRRLFQDDTLVSG